MAASTLQLFSHLVVLVGVLLTAAGSFGAYYFGKKAENEYRISLGTQIAALVSPAEVLHMAAAERLARIGGMVWEIADRLLQETGQMDRTALVQACMEEGINMNTASTQYSHWKNAITSSTGGQL